MWFLILSHLLLARTHLPLRGRRSEGFTLIVHAGWLSSRRRIWYFCQSSVPVGRGAISRWASAMKHRVGPARYTPLRARRSSNASGLVLLWMHVLRNGCILLVGHAGGLAIVAEKLESRFDVQIGRIKIECSLVSIQRIGSLVVTRLILRCISFKESYMISDC